MAEFRVHWEEQGMIRYSWHRSHNQAHAELFRIRKRLGYSSERLGEHRNIVRFDLYTADKPHLLDFLNEHVSDGPSCPA